MRLAASVHKCESTKCKIQSKAVADEKVVADKKLKPLMDKFLNTPPNTPAAQKAIDKYLKASQKVNEHMLTSTTSKQLSLCSKEKCKPQNRKFIEAITKNNETTCKEKGYKYVCALANAMKSDKPQTLLNVNKTIARSRV